MKHNSRREADKPQITLAERISRYMDNVEPSISGQNGHDAAFRAACKLVIGFALSEAEALPHMRTWNLRCSPAWEDRDLERKIREAMKARQRNPSQVGQLLGNVRDYARSNAPRPYSGPQAARSHASSPSRPQASGSSSSSSPLGPQAPARSLPFLVAGAGAAPLSPAEQAGPVPSAPAASAPSLPASVLAAVRASVALWEDQSGDKATAVVVPAGQQWPENIDGLTVIIDPAVREITPVRTETDGRDGCGATPISARTHPPARG